MKIKVILLLSALSGMAVGAGLAKITALKNKGQNRMMSEKHLALFLMMNQWIKVKQEGKSLERYFKEHEYNNIAVYGMSYAGEALINELKNTDIHVVYGIDRNADSIYSDIDIVSMENHLKKVDAIVVTAITFFDEIEKKLSKKINCPIISLEDILYKI